MTRLLASCKICFVTGAPNRVTRQFRTNYTSAWSRLDALGYRHAGAAGSALPSPMTARRDNSKPRFKRLVVAGE